MNKWLYTISKQTSLNVELIAKPLANICAFTDCVQMSDKE